MTKHRIDIRIELFVDDADFMKWRFIMTLRLVEFWPLLSTEETDFAIFDPLFWFLGASYNLVKP